MELAMIEVCLAQARIADRKNGPVFNMSPKSSRDSGYRESYPDLACADTFAHSGNNAQMDSMDCEGPRIVLQNRLIKICTGDYTCGTFSIEEAWT
jgi:hypothetical protein